MEGSEALDVGEGFESSRMGEGLILISLLLELLSSKLLLEMLSIKGTVSVVASGTAFAIASETAIDKGAEDIDNWGGYLFLFWSRVWLDFILKGRSFETVSEILLQANELRGGMRY